MYLPPDVKERLSRVKASLLSVTDEVESVFSNNAIELLNTKTEYLSLTVREMENVLKGTNKIIDGNGLWDLLERMIDVKDNFRKFIGKCKLLESGEMRLIQIQKHLKAVEGHVYKTDG